MTLASGDRLGSYEITSLLGAGGMGEVYRARDTRLKRDVALKILRELFATDTERLARFQREAEVLASLNHPNIAAIHGLEESNGTRALIMELVEGETLADRIGRGPIPIDEAIPIAKQIAEALEAAHEQGIIHRDLKPANIKIRPDGTVKVLDFGLAKALEPAGPTPDATQSPTITSPAVMTSVGVLLGTAAYMSPEQARGKSVDKRSDIWAFGCVLYEMLTGRRAFEGEDVSETLANVLKLEPDWQMLPRDVPTSVRALLQMCLTKTRQERVADASVALFVLSDKMLVALASTNRVPATRGRTIRRAAVVVTTVVAAGLTGAYVGLRSSADVPQVVSRFTVQLGENELFTNSAQRVVAVSPAGDLIAYVANNRLYLRRLDRLEATPIRGVEGAGGSSNPRNPFFSPDGEWIAFWQEGQIKKVAATGGTPVTICAAENIAGANWEPDDTIVFGEGLSAIWRVSANGGTPQKIVALADGQFVRTPQLLPDRKTILFTVSDNGNWDDSRVVVQALDGGTPRTVIARGTEGRYLPTGHIAYVDGATLLGVPYDVNAGQASGGPVPLVEGVARQGLSATTSTTGVAHFAVSSGGTLVHVPTIIDQGSRTLAWVDRAGREELVKAPPRSYQYPRISPDGTRVALDVRDEDTDIWIWHFARETLTRVTFGGSRDILPVWTPDSRRIVFRSEQNSPGNLYWRAADGTGTEERLTNSPQGHVAYGISPDASLLLFRVDGGPKNAADLWLFRFNNHQAEPLLQSPFNERHAELSPDGRWLAYASDESGDYEVYVRPFPKVEGGRWQISSGGGNRPLWSRDGQELFFMSPTGTIMGARIERRSTWSASAASKIVEGAYYFGGPGLPDRPYDISPDGRRFLMIKNAPNRAEWEGGPRLVVTQQWFEELKSLVPTN